MQLLAEPQHPGFISFDEPDRLTKALIAIVLLRDDQDKTMKTFKYD